VRANALALKRWLDDQKIQEAPTRAEDEADDTPLIDGNVSECRASNVLDHRLGRSLSK